MEWSQAAFEAQRQRVARRVLYLGNSLCADRSAELVSAGVAVHHAGIEAGDRATIEKAFLSGDIGVICCTSTLAVGVNLPCHLAILKNTVAWEGGSTHEYSDLDVMQMIGRAGRPQFDDSAVAVILTRLQKVDKYQRLMSGQEILESW